MNKILIVAIILAIITGSLSCGTGTSSVAGTYVCTQGSSDYDEGNVLELKKDGSLYAYNPGESGISGTWRVDGGDIYLVYEIFGITSKGKLNGDSFTLGDGSSWVKE